MNIALSPERQSLLGLLRLRGRCAGHEIIARTLVQHGITHVFAVNGNPVNPLLGACAKLGLRVIGARHQQGAVLMSLAYNYVSGGLCSVVICSAGPAVTNCATGLFVGQSNRWPLLVIGGRFAIDTPGGFQAFDGAQFFTPVSKWTTLVDSAAHLGDRLAQAVQIAMAGAPGPVYLDITDEALAGYADCTVTAMPASAPATALPSVTSTIPPDQACFRHALSLLAAARRPVMLIGKGARWSEPSSLLRRLADDHGIAFATSPMGRGLLSDDHPLCFSEIRGRMLADADLVLVIGARFDWTFRFGTEISPHAQIIHIDIDPIEAANVLGRGVALQGDVAGVVHQLLAGLDAQAAGCRVTRDREWLDDLAARRAALNLHAVPSAELGLLPMSPYEWLAEMGAVLPDDALTVLDGNTVMTAAQRMLVVRRPVSRLGPGINGCMGVGIPFAIGAKLARPEAPVVAIVGDYAFGISAIELETAVRHRVPVVVVVANNAGPGGARVQRAFFPADHPERVVQYGANIRHDLTMTSFGGRSRRVDVPGQLAAAVTEALAGDEPVCIDVITNENTALSAAI